VIPPPLGLDLLAALTADPPRSTAALLPFASGFLMALAPGEHRFRLPDPTCPGCVL
jgi:hypothetical protein